MLLTKLLEDLIFLKSELLRISSACVSQPSSTSPPPPSPRKHNGHFLTFRKSGAVKAFWGLGISVTSILWLSILSTLIPSHSLSSSHDWTFQWVGRQKRKWGGARPNSKNHSQDSCYTPLAEFGHTATARECYRNLRNAVFILPGSTKS